MFTSKHCVKLHVEEGDTDSSIATELEEERRGEDKIDDATGPGRQGAITHVLRTRLHTDTQPHGQSVELQVQRQGDEERLVHQEEDTPLTGPHWLYLNHLHHWDIERRI